MERVVSISTAAFDGYDFHTAFEEIARLGVRTVNLPSSRGTRILFLKITSRIEIVPLTYKLVEGLRASLFCILRSP